MSDTGCLEKIYLNYLTENKIPPPRIIHVETRSKCNGLCSFCQASATTDKREDIYMPDELIDNIIGQLSKQDYYNRLSIYNNNEPFLDDRIFDIVRLARDKLPKAYLELKSNGKILTTDKIINIFNSGLDMLYINAYSKSGELDPNIQRIKDELKTIRRFKGHLEGGEYYRRIMIIARSFDDVLGSRAGSSPNKQYDAGPLKKACFRPFEMMTISPKGDVSVCSEDFHYSILMGNIKQQSLSEIWESEKFMGMREKLIKGDRSCTAACSKCDYRGFTYEMLAEHGLNKTSGIKKAIKKYLS